MDSGHRQWDHYGSRITDTVTHRAKIMSETTSTLDIVNEITALDQQILLLMVHTADRVDSGHHKWDNNDRRHTDTVTRSSKIMRQTEWTLDIINQIIMAPDQQILLLMVHKQRGRQSGLDIINKIIMAGGIQTLLLIVLNQRGTQNGF